MREEAIIEKLRIAIERGDSAEEIYEVFIAPKEELLRMYGKIFENA